MSKKLVYIVLGVISFLIRLYIEFRSNIISGINGGYYPVQVRKLIDHGALAIQDMPIVFYVNAFFVKIASNIFPTFSTDYIVLLTVKILGALTIPLLLFPLYKINSKLITNSLSKIYEYSLVAFCLFSFSPIYLGAEMMKNAFGLIGFAYLLYFVFQFVTLKSTKYALLIGLTLILIGNTHFGVFSVSIIFLVIALIVVYKKHAILPILFVFLVGFLLVWIYDPARAFNGINIFQKWLGLPWRIAVYPIGIVNSIVNILVILILLSSLRTKKIEKPQKQIFLILIVFLVLVMLPILKFELWRRFNFMLFIPQAIALTVSFPYLKNYRRKQVSLIINIVCCLAIVYNVFAPKKSIISYEAYNDLANISNKIENPNETLIVTRHGLDWWVVWQLKTKMAQPQIKIDKSILNKYDEILILRQKKGVFDLYPGPGSPFIDPRVPENSTLIYTSDFFELYKR